MHKDNGCKDYNCEQYRGLKTFIQNENITFHGYVVLNVI